MKSIDNIPEQVKPNNVKSMKKSMYLCVLFLLLGITTNSQEINKLNKSATVRKGRIILKTGKSETFKHLNLNDSVITYQDPIGNIIGKDFSDVSLITKKGSYAGLGAILLGSFMVIAIIGSEADISAGTGSKVARGDYPMVFFFAGFGALVGSFFKKEKIIYKDRTPITFSPSVISAPCGKQYAAVSLKIHF